MKTRYWVVTALAIGLLAGCASQQSLLKAASNQQPEKVQKLIDKGFNPYLKNETGMSPLDIAVKQSTDGSLPDWAEQLEDASITTANSYYHDIKRKKRSPKTFSTKLAQHDFYLDVQNDKGQTLLYRLASHNSPVGYIDALLKAGANPDIATQKGYTPLMVAIRENSTKTVKLLLAAHAKVNTQDRDGSSALYWAAINNRAKLVPPLVKAGADTEQPDNQGWTPLIEAVYKGNVAVTKALLKAHANVNASDKKGWTPLHFTANKSKSGNRKHDAKLARLLIKAGANINATQNSGATPLYLAFGNDRSKVQSVLIQAGADVNLAKNNGWTPLMLSVFDGKVDAVKTLLAAGADPNLKDESGWTALHFTANPSESGNREHDVELVKLLLAAGADINSRKSNGETPLYLAVNNNRLDVLNALLQAHANTDLTKSSNGWSPLMEAVYKGNIKVAKALLASGADVNIQGEKGWTALQMTANSLENGDRNHDVELARLLIRAHANLNVTRKGGATPLYTAIGNGRIKVLNALIHAHANVNKPNDRGWTPLMEAVFKGKVAMVKTLIHAHAKLNARNKNGWTALHFTANATGDGYGDRTHDGEIARLLLKAGAKPNIITGRGSTPFDLALDHHRYSLQRILLEGGAKDTRFPARPAKKSGVTTCNTRCINGKCWRTYGDGHHVHFQAEKHYNSLSGQWEYDSGSC